LPGRRWLRDQSRSRLIETERLPCRNLKFMPHPRRLADHGASNAVGRCWLKTSNRQNRPVASNAGLLVRAATTQKRSKVIAPCDFELSVISSDGVRTNANLDPIFVDSRSR